MRSVGRLSQDGGNHRRYASLDNAMRKLRLSTDSAHSPSPSSDAEVQTPSSRPPSVEPAAPSPGSSILKTQPARDNGPGLASSVDLDTLREEEEEEEEGGDDAASATAMPARANGTLEPGVGVQSLLEDRSGSATVSHSGGGSVAAAGAAMNAPDSHREADMASPWQSANATDLSLATLELLAEWLVQAAPHAARYQS